MTEEKTRFIITGYDQDREDLKSYSSWSGLITGEGLHVLLQMFEYRIFADSEGQQPPNNPMLKYVALTAHDSGLIDSQERDKLVKMAEVGQTTGIDILKMLGRLEYIRENDLGVYPSDYGITVADDDTPGAVDYNPGEETR